jgi:hypothetical protein
MTLLDTHRSFDQEKENREPEAEKVWKSHFIFFLTKFSGMVTIIAGKTHPFHLSSGR